MKNVISEAKEILFNAKQKWVDYSHFYEAIHANNPDKIKEKAKTHAALQGFLDAANSDLKITKARLYKILIRLFLEEISLPSYKHFVNATLPLIKSRGIVEYLNSHVGKKNAQKFTQDHVALIMHEYLVELATAPYIHRKLNPELNRLGLKNISLGTVKNIIKANKHIWDEKKYNLAKDHELKGVGIGPEHPLTMVMIDGSTLAYPYIDHQAPPNERIKQLVFFIVLDVHSKKIIGWSLDTSENVIMILQAVEMACMVEGYLPGEIKSDNSSSFKKKEWETFKSLAHTIGSTEFTKHRPHRSTGKSQVEKAVNLIEDILKTDPHFIGGSVKSKKRNSRKSEASINELLKTKNLPSRNEVVKRFEQVINEYNNTRYNNKASAAEAYSKTRLRPYATRLEFKHIVNLFWKTTTAKVSPSGQFKIQVRNESYVYAIGIDEMLKLSARKPGKGLGRGYHSISVKYDNRTGMGVVHCFDAKNTTEYLFKVNEQPGYRIAAKERDESDKRITDELWERNKKVVNATREALTLQINNTMHIHSSYMMGKEELKQSEDEVLRSRYANERYMNGEESIMPKMDEDSDVELITKRDTIKTDLRVLK